MSGAGSSEVVAWERQAFERLLGCAVPGLREAAVRALAAEAAKRADAARGRDADAGLDWARAAESLLAREIADPGDPDRTRAKRRIAAHLHAQARHAEALVLLDELRGALEASDRQGRAELEGARTGVLARLGRTQEAERAARRSRADWLALGRRDAAAQVDVNLGNVLHRRERHREALACYRRALKGLGDLPAGMARAVAWLGIGNTSSFLGREAEALTAYETSETLFADAGREHHRLVAAYNRHYLELLVGRPQAALNGLGRVRAGFVAAGDEAAATNCDLDVAEVLLHLRTWPEAEDRARRAVESATSLDLGTERARASVHLARALVGQGGADRAREAEDLLTQAEAIFELERNAAGGAHALVLRADLLLERGRHAEALPLARRAAGLLKSAGIATREAAALVAESRALLGDSPTPGARKTARGRLERAAGLGRKGKWTTVEARALLARLAFESGDLGGARREAGAAARLAGELGDELENDRLRSSLLGDLHGVFRQGVRYWLAGPRPNLKRAFDLAERSRCFSLAEGRRLAPRERRRALAAFGAEARAGTRGVAAPAVIDRSGAAAQTRERSLPSLELKLAQEALKPGELLLSFQTWPGSERRSGAPDAIVLAISHDSRRAVELPAGDLEEAVARLGSAAERRAFLAASEAPAPARDAARRVLQSHAADLGARLLAPVAADLESAGRVLIVPEGPLLGLPFGLLPLPGGEEPLGLAREVVHLPAASWLARRSLRRAKTSPVVAAGCADESAPLIDRELKSLASAARRWGSEVRTLRGVRATFNAFAEAVPEGRVVHFAGHGAFRWDAAEQSALRFADGWVSLAEIEALNFRSEVSILSACRGGAVRAGGGQFAGLTRALLRAGSKSVIASPWTVGDAEAAGLFRVVHGALAQGASPAAALRQGAARAADPTDALSFILMGAPWCGSSPVPGRLTDPPPRAHIRSDPSPTLRRSR